MSFLLYNKVRCAICGKKFLPYYCMLCKKRDFGLCPTCHKNNKNHKEELRNIRRI